MRSEFSGIGQSAYALVSPCAGARGAEGMTLTNKPSYGIVPPLERERRQFMRLWCSEHDLELSMNSGTDL